ncbi:unnamed protein product [Moneuplotes crassus]|uniref:Uncharacterized protein n=1 Tax=Euplotes crassus TaxID=5936 RepID=A0AAD1XN70_EUPCR|nr:unnamed protein product [Moneuplotes crassus]
MFHYLQNSSRNQPLDSPTEEEYWDKIAQESIKLEGALSIHLKECEVLQLKAWYGVYKAFFDSWATFERSRSMNLNFAQPQHLKVSKKMKSLTLPSLRTVNWLNVSFTRKWKDAFFKKCFLSRIQCFSVSLNELSDSRRLLLRLSQVSYKVTKVITFYFLIINESQMKRLMMLVKHIMKVRLSSCKLNFVEVIDLSKCLRRTTIEELHTSDCARSIFSNWVNKPEGFSNFIESLSKSDLKSSLQKFHLDETQLDKDFAKEVFLKNKFKDVMLVKKYR